MQLTKDQLEAIKQRDAKGYSERRWPAMSTALELWRVSIGMQQRTVYAEGMFDAAHKCGLGSGDILRATIELLDEATGKPIASGGFAQVSEQ